MTIKTTTLLPNHPFWGFSCQIYGDTKENLLGLQNRYNLNVNMLLFCLWFAANNHGLLTKQELKHLLTSIHTWHERIVMPLRHLRNTLQKAYAGPDWTDPVRSEVLATELTAEQIEELLIVDAAPKKAQRNRSRTYAQRAAHACQNIVTYCQVLYIYLDDVDCTSLGEVLSTVFPELSAHDALNLCRSVLGGKNQVNKLVQKQLQLELLVE